MAVSDVRTQSTSPTLAQVARSAGVSIATASRVLNDSGKVSLEAHDRVHAAVGELRYVRHRAPVTRGHDGPIGSIAAVIHAEHSRLFGDAFFQRLITAASVELAAHGLSLVVISVTPASLLAAERYLHRGHLDGAIVVADHGPHSLAVSLPTEEFPVVVVGRSTQPSRAPYIDADNRAAAQHVVEFLFAQRRRRIAHIAGPPDTAAAADRLAGFHDGMRAMRAAEQPVAYGDWSHASAVHAMDRLLDKWPHLDAVFAASDAMAAGAVWALQRSGRNVPGDVAVVGFDDLPLALQVNPALTTVRQPIEEFGTLAVRKLLTMIESGSGVPTFGPEATVLPTTLIRRKSA